MRSGCPVDAGVLAPIVASVRARARVRASSTPQQWCHDEDEGDKEDEEEEGPEEDREEEGGGAISRFEYMEESETCAGAELKA